MQINKYAIFLIAIITASGCARNAPELPPETSTIEATKVTNYYQLTEDDNRLNCAQIIEEKAALESQVLTLEGKIKENRTQNQVAGYVGLVLFFPALAATNSNREAKKGLDSLQFRSDQLNYLHNSKNCS